MKETEKRTVSIFRALGSPTRFKIIQLLSSATLCTSEIANILRKKSTTISKHLKILRDLDLVYYITRDKKVFNRLKKKRILSIIEEVEEIFGRE